MEVRRVLQLIFRHAKHRLQQQRSLVEDPNFVIKTQKWVPDETGEKHLREKQKRVRPWWRTDITGAVMLTVRYGARPIEFSKGKSGIAVGTKDTLLGVIDVIIGAAVAGELDGQIAQMSNASQFNKAKRAA